MKIGGSGVGTATGLITSGAIDRALQTQKAKKELKEECLAQGGIIVKGECKTLANTVEKTVENAADIATAPSRGALKAANKEIGAVGSTINQTKQNIVEPTLEIADDATNTVSKALPAIKDVAAAYMTGGASFGLQGALDSMEPKLNTQFTPSTLDKGLDMRINANRFQNTQIHKPMQSD